MACEEFFLRNSAKIMLQLSTTNTTVRKIINEVCAVTLAQVYVANIRIKIIKLIIFIFLKSVKTGGCNSNDPKGAKSIGI